VADLATAELLAGLMGMTIIALGMSWETGNELAGVKPVTTIAFRDSGSGRHLCLVQMVRVRESLEPELAQLCRKADGLWSRLERNLVANLAQAAGFSGVFAPVTIDAGSMPGKSGLGSVVGPLMTQHAVLLLVLGPVVIESDASIEQGCIGHADDAGRRLTGSR